jgi:hypothetical protein
MSTLEKRIKRLEGMKQQRLFPPIFAFEGSDGLFHDRGRTYTRPELEALQARQTFPPVIIMDRPKGYKPPEGAEL